MDPSEVRARVLSDHARIRKMLDDLDARIADARASTHLGAVRDSGTALLQELMAHIGLEDALLAPALREADAWGPVRADHLEKHHREQRIELVDVLTALHSPRPDLVALLDRLQVFAEAVYDDMRYEETNLLDPEILRDDVVVIRQTGG